MIENANDAIAEQSSLLPLVRSLTPARIFTGRAGLGYSTATQLALRADHAAAIDSVRREIDLGRDFDPRFVAERNLFEVQSQARDKEEYLRRPDLGRRLDDAARARLGDIAGSPCDLQVVIGDGLSVAAVAAQTPSLVAGLGEKARALGWTVGPVFLVRYCRVGIINDIGDLLAPRVMVLLIGERPGLATAESLSAYMAYRPQAGHTDAHRNLISNIHARGVGVESAGARIIALAGQMMDAQTSGWGIKEALCLGRMPPVRPVEAHVGCYSRGPAPPLLSPLLLRRPKGPTE